MPTYSVEKMSKAVKLLTTRKGENFVMTSKEEKTEKKAGVGVYSFRPKEVSILVEGKALADAYGISLNQLLTFCLESAIEEWSVPYMTPRQKPGERSGRPENEGVYEKPLTDK